MKLSILALVLLAFGAQAAAFASPGPAVSLQIQNDVPKFERFYRDASKPGVSEAQRWQLWKSEYDLAAVPPTPEGDALARKQLDAQWPRYAALVPRLPALTAQAIANAQTAVRNIERNLDPAGHPVTIVLRLYVGQFDGNAFSMPAMNGRPPATLMPVETDGILLLEAHELSHTVHFGLAGVRNSFGAPVGELVFLEGLAMRSASRAVPGLADEAYTELPDDHGWLKRCYANQTAVLNGIASELDAAGPQAGTKFTFGDGTTGMRREAYCAGWIVFGRLLAQGRTLEDLAALPEAKMIEVVRAAILAR